MRILLKFSGVLFLYAFCLNFQIQAQNLDTISFTWTNIDNSTKSMDFRGTSNEKFTLNWGDGNIQEFTGEGEKTIACKYNYKSEGSFTVILTAQKASGRLSFLDITSYTPTNNAASYLDVSRAPLLTQLRFGSNEVTEIDLSKNTSLTALFCQSNKLSTLDISKNGSLKSLFCQSNLLSTLDISNNYWLSTIVCQNNAFSLFDLYQLSQRVEDPTRKSIGTQRRTLVKESNEPIDYSHDITLGNKTSTFTFNRFGDIAIPDVDYTFNNGILIFLQSGIYEVKLSNENIISDPKIPVDVVHTYIVGEVSNDTISFDWTCYANVNKTLTFRGTHGKNFNINWGDGSTQTFIGDGNVDIVCTHSYKNHGSYAVIIATEDISSRFYYLGLRGVKNLSNGITSINVSKAPLLTNLDLEYNALEILDISQNKLLLQLNCNNNILSSLDISKNTRLVSLYCSGNQLTDIDVSDKKDLKYFHCSKNRLTTLDISQNLELYSLYCSENRLTTLNVSQNTKLTGLVCYKNKLTAINIGDDNTDLGPLYCYDNALMLSQLYVLSKKVSSPYLGVQTIAQKTIFISDTLDLSDEYIFDNILSDFEVRKDGVITSDYVNHSGKIVFNQCGLYTFTMRNDEGVKTSGDKAAVTAIYEVTAAPPLLASLLVSEGVLMPAFNPHIKNYSINVDYDVVNLNIDATTIHHTVLVSGIGQKDLSVGSNTFNLLVTSSDGVTATYTLAVYRSSTSSDATLKELQVSEGILTPAFNAAIKNYTVNVGSEIASLTISATTNHNTSNITGIGVKDLSVGTNVFNLIVTSQNGTNSSYTITVNRGTFTPSNNASLSHIEISYGSLSPSFHSDITYYDVSVPYHIEMLSISPTMYHSEAKVNGYGDKSLKVGLNIFNIMVVAEDGITTKNYIVMVNREDIPSNIKEESESSISFYPNPITDMMYLNPKVDALISIYSLQGTLLKQVVGSCINLSEFSNGIYIIKVNGVSKKVIKR